MYVFSAIVNGCTVRLYLTQDKEIWMAYIAETADGTETKDQSYPPGAMTFESVGTKAELQARPDFAAICP